MMVLVKKITIYLNTNGGNVAEGLLICNVIERLKTPTEIIALANIYSMGALIIMAGCNNPNVTRKCYPFTTGLIHSGSTYIGGTSTQVRDFNDFNLRYEKMISEYIISHSAITEEEYEKMHRYEWYLTSKDLLDKKLIDEIL